MNDQTEHDAERFLTALEQKVQELLVLSKIPISNPTKLSFVDYKKFREKSDECLSFLVIIEGRISEVEGERKDLLSEQFDKLVVATWSVLMEGSIGFLTVLSEREYLPVGTRHVFEQELKTLSEAEDVMKENKNQKLLADNMAEKREKAKEILKVVIERAPELLNVEVDLDEAIKSYSEVVSTLNPDQELDLEATLDDASNSESEATSDDAAASEPEVSPDGAVSSEEGLGSNLNSELNNGNDPNVDSIPGSDGEADQVNSSVAES